MTDWHKYYNLGYGAEGVPLSDSWKTVFTENPEYSRWTCHLFGSEPGNGMMWTPLRGKHPNRFWRWMQYICFGNKWVRDSDFDGKSESQSQ